MSNREWTLYSTHTGFFKAIVGCAEELLERNIPPGYAAMPGRHDLRTQRVDVVLLEASKGDFSPPEDFIVARSPEGLSARERRRFARHAIERLERAQLRPMRELALDPDNGDAKRRLRELDDAIAAKRADL